MLSRSTTVSLHKTIKPDRLAPSELRSLAGALDRLIAFHRERGGASPDSPRLTGVWVENDKIIARIHSGDRTFELEFVPGLLEWSLR